MKPSPDVERWLAGQADPPQSAIRRVRDIILRSDRRVSDYIKYGTLVFGYDGDFVSFVP